MLFLLFTRCSTETAAVHQSSPSVWMDFCVHVIFDVHALFNRDGGRSPVLAVGVIATLGRLDDLFLVIFLA
jgi:hypothetical protein